MAQFPEPTDRNRSQYILRRVDCVLWFVLKADWNLLKNTDMFEI